MQKTEKKI